MLQSLKKLIACLRQRSVRPVSAPTRRARLDLERLETREVLSASLSPIPGAALAPALPATPVPHADSTGGLLGGIATPDQPVYGYKHRKRIPRALDAQGTPTESAVAASFLRLEGIVGQPTHDRPPTALSAQALALRDGVFLHLAAGGSDGPTALSGNGLFVVHSPEGPLPTEALATIG
jgi:hypothetical protein